MHSTLINFNVSTATKHRFDEICRVNGRTRTSVLVEMMEKYVLEQGQALAKRRYQMSAIDRTLEDLRKMMGSYVDEADQAADDRIARQNRSISEFDLPAPLWSDDPEIW